MQVTQQISGGSATEIADSVRALLERSDLAPGDPLPPVRTLADELGVNRNTVMAAYRQLAGAGLIITRGRAGTRVVESSPVAQEGFAKHGSLRDVGTGNPDPRFIPDPSAALSAMAGRPILYGEPVIDPGLAAWAGTWMRGDLGDRPHRLTVTSGAVDAVERILAQALTRDDPVALEDPCFLASIHTVRLGGYRAVPVPIDDEGMTVEGLRAALEQGVRAVVCTPRAQNPTGASLSAERAEQLRGVLAEHLGLRLSPGTTWVSHLLQRLVLSLVTDEQARETISAAASHYAERNAAFTDRLRAVGISCAHADGLNLWVPLPIPAARIAARMQERGWLVRTGDEFVLGDPAAAHHLRLTVHALPDADAERLAADLGAAVQELSTNDGMG